VALDPRVARRVEGVVGDHGYPFFAHAGGDPAAQTTGGMYHGAYTGTDGDGGMYGTSVGTGTCPHVGQRPHVGHGAGALGPGAVVSSVVTGKTPTPTVRIPAASG